MIRRLIEQPQITIARGKLAFTVRVFKLKASKAHAAMWTNEQRKLFKRGAKRDG